MNEIEFILFQIWFQVQNYFNFCYFLKFDNEAKYRSF